MPRRGYHHGDLKEALIAAALELVRENGIAGFSFAEAARKAGVSPAAPYRHFKDRDDLLRETARRGFETLAAGLDGAWNGGKPSPLAALDAMGCAYLAFARDRSDYFIVMFDAGTLAHMPPELQAMADRAFDVIVQACAVMVERMPAASRPPAHMVAYHIWSQFHGTAELFGKPGSSKTPISPEEMLETGIGIYLRGLGILTD